MTEQERRKQPSVGEIMYRLLDIGLEKQVDALQHFPVLLLSSDPISPYLTSPQEKNYRPQTHTPVEQIDSIYNNVIYRRGRELGERLASLQIEKNNLPVKEEEYNGEGKELDEYRVLKKLITLNIAITDENIVKLAVKAYNERKPRLGKAILYGYCNRHEEEYAKTEENEVKARKLAGEKKSHVHSLYAILTGEDPEDTDPDTPGGGGPPPPDGGDREPRNPRFPSPEIELTREEPSVVDSVSGAEETHAKPTLLPVGK